MNRFALTGLVLGLMAGTATAQTAQYGGYEQAAPSSSRTILKGVSSSEPVIPASATAYLSGATTAQEPAAAGQNGAAASTEAAKCGGCSQEWTDCCCDSGCGWMFFAEWMYLQPRGSDAVFATRALNCFGPPTGVEQFDLGNQDAYRAGFYKQCGPCSDIGASFWMFESHENERAAPTTGTDVIFPALLFPTIRNITTGCNDATSTSARASLDIDFDRIAIDYRNRFEACCIEWEWLVGFGYGKLDQELLAIYDEGFVKVDSDLHGYGLRVGGGGTYNWGCFRGYLRSDFTLLAANLKARYRNVDTFDGDVADYEQNLDRLVPVLDIEVGLAYDLCCNTTLKFGYIYSIWWNVVTTPSFAEDVINGDITGNSGDTLTFDGIFARVEINF
jgi:hypothetical protein